MEGFCRGCLIKYDDPIDLLQYTEKNRRLFVYSTGLQVKRNDTFTFQLCKNCYLNMKLACKFKKFCRTSDKRFKNYLSLKDVDQSLDFCNYLKQSDDNFNIRFPLPEGNSTPVNQRLKDDDNESTCTSIRNFMTDILQGEEMPDTEARIIKEVIEEEADVLDDSLDSHWLQDDASIDTDFRLDFSFSPFSTPRPEKNNHCYTPIKLSKEKEHEQLNYYTSKAIIEKPDRIDELNTINKAIENIPNNGTESIFEEIVLSPKTDLDIEEPTNHETLGINAQNYYVQRDIFGDDLDSIIKENVKVEDKNDQCTIDRNLETALKNKTVDEFSLDDLLVSPPEMYHLSIEVDNPIKSKLSFSTVYPNIAGQMTPTITNILFSDKLDSSSLINQNTGKCIEKFQIVDGCDNLDGFFDDSKVYEPDCINDSVIDNGVINNQNKPEGKINFQKVNENDTRDLWLLGKNFDIENLYCKLCDKKFDTLKSLRIHVSKRHKIKIINTDKKVFYKRKKHVCDICGKTFRDKTNVIRHQKTHAKVDPNKVYQCDICRLICTNQIKLEQHMKTHNPQPNDVKEKKYVCNICGKSSTTKTNFTVHQWRHTKNYQFYCTDCGKGFYRTTDLTNHMRYHTLEKPFQCPHCLGYYSQSTALVQHIRNIHLGEKYFQCECCNIKHRKKRDLINHLKKEENKRQRYLQKTLVKKTKKSINKEVKMKDK